MSRYKIGELVVLDLGIDLFSPQIATVHYVDESALGDRYWLCFGINRIDGSYPEFAIFKLSDQNEAILNQHYRKEDLPTNAISNESTESS